MSRPKTFILDNYDSYVYNLYQRVGELTGASALVVRNDKTTLELVRDYEPTHIIVSPGPGRPGEPAYVGVCADVIRELGSSIPVLGVCLGHQVIAHVFGASVIRASQVMHGKTSDVLHTGSRLYSGLESSFKAMRYHSLVIDPATVPSDLRVTAKTRDGVIMSVEHVRYPIFGVQFHPESIGTPSGYVLLKNFLAIERP